jgi:NADH/NAD ratio-sensing transcriptional regulator Rex
LNERLLNKDWCSKKHIYSSVINDINIISNILEPSVSVIVISWRFHPDTLKSVQILQKQRDQNFELIFVNNGANKKDFEPLFQYIDTYIELNNNTGAYLARNIGAVFSQAPILIFLEDDGIPDIEFIKMHKIAHELHNPISVRGVCLPKTENELNKYAIHYFLGESVFSHFVDLEGNSSYSAKEFFEVGGWDDEIIFGGGGPELAIRLYEKYDDIKKQIYWPYAIILHDYALNDKHFKDKKEKQRASLKRFREKYSEWEYFINVFISDKNIFQLKRQNFVKIIERYKDVLIEFQKKTMKYVYKKEIDIFEDKLKKIVKNRKIAIFGSGRGGMENRKYLENFNFQISCFIDNNEEKIGTKIDKLDIMSIYDIKKSDYFIIISSAFGIEIGEQLTELGFKFIQDFIII